MKIYIYAIYFPTSNKFYVGQTAYLERRLFTHLKNKSLVGNALRKYDNWQVEILHTTKDRDSANLLEIEEIRHYNCVAPNGYNLTRGGDGFSDPTGEIAKKISIALTGRKNLKHSKFMTGRQHSLGKKRPDLVERNKKDKPAKGKHWIRLEESKEKNRIAQNNIITRYKYLKTKIANLEKDTNNDD